ncbi:hypothetical protein FB639_001317 [Coemansia asiatica]|nr:hypothetical protein FB639_001317 [Coemansia asiatica]
MACGNRGARTRWLRSDEKYNSSFEQFEDFVFVMDEQNNVQRLELLELDAKTNKLVSFKQDFRVHGFDIYYDDLDTTELTFMFVNHQRSGSGVSIFKHKLGDSFIQHVATVKSPLLYSPNDVVATSRRTFYATNDVKYAPGFMRKIEVFFGMPWGH